MTSDAAGCPRLATVIVPCRNERGYIERFCAAAMRQALPSGWSLELVVADGRSGDGTREVLEAIAAAEPRIRWIDNPAHIVSAGLNAALAISTGEVVVRMDVHTDYAEDYLARCLSVLAETHADNVGGPWRAVPDPGGGAMQRAVAAAFQSPWVAGGARSRRLDYEGWADTVYLGCWPRQTFERFGRFDEALVRNQDDEHNLRILRGGGRIWQSPHIRSEYRPRAKLRQVFRQYLQYGYWKPFVAVKHRQAASLRHAVPGAFVALVSLAAILAMAGLSAVPVALLGGLYGAAILVMTAQVARSQKPVFSVVVRVPAVIAAYHIGYGIGSIVGCWDAVLRGSSRARFAVLTR